MIDSNKGSYDPYNISYVVTVEQVENAEFKVIEPVSSAHYGGTRVALNR